MNTLTTVTQTGKNKVLDFAENHPHLLLAVIIILLIVLLVTYFGNNKRLRAMISGCKKKTKDPFNNEEEMDKLIESIHNKQSKSKTDT